MDTLWDQSGSKAVLLHECVWTFVSAKNKNKKPAKPKTNARTDIDLTGARAQ